MAIDYNNGNNAAQAKPSMGITLLEFIMKRDPGLLAPMAIMNGKNVLNFFQELFSPPKLEEGKRELENSIAWSYAERLIYSIRKFRGLDTMAQQEIIDASKFKIWWRGDDPEKFSQLIDETLHYRELSEQEKNTYRKTAMAQALTFLNRNG